MDEIPIYELPANVKDRTGYRNTRLTAIHFSHVARGAGSMWWFRCDCGAYRIYRFSAVARNNNRSCGCLAVDVGRATCVRRNTTHGMRHTRLYNIFSGMHLRCYFPSQPAYRNYGARGIDVCTGWRKNFVTFAAWAQRSGYADDLELDRIDNDKGYGPGNCRWVTHEVNANNMAKNVRVSHNGETKTISEWARCVGMRRGTLRTRLMVLLWPIEKALTTPLRVTKRSPGRH